MSFNGVCLRIHSSTAYRLIEHGPGGNVRFCIKCNHVNTCGAELVHTLQILPQSILEVDEKLGHVTKAEVLKSESFFCSRVR